MFPTPHRVAVLRETQTQSETTGEMVYSSSAVASGVACYIQQQSGFESQQHMRTTGERTYQVFFRSGVDVRSGDRLQPQSGSPQAGGTFLVTSPPDTWSGVYVAVNASLEDGRL